MEPRILQDFQEISTSELPQTKLPCPEHVWSGEGLEISREGLEAFLLSLGNLMDLIILHSPVGNRKEPALSN